MPIDTVKVESGKSYRAVFAYPAGIAPPVVNVPRTLSALGYTVTLSKWENRYTSRELVIVFTVAGEDARAGSYVQGDVTHSPLGGENRIQVLPLAVPVSALILAALAVLGVAMLYLTLTEIDEVIATPAGTALSFGAVLLAVFLMWLYLKKLQ